MTFGELRQKDVINICDGRRLGKPIDVALSDAACVTALIVPSPGGFLSCLKPDREGRIHPLGAHPPHRGRRDSGGIGCDIWPVAEKGRCFS